MSKRTIIWPALAGVCALTFAALLWSDERDELREQARNFQREAATLAERGHTREAHELREKAAAMLAEAEAISHRERVESERRHPEHHPDAHRARLEHRLHELREELGKLARAPGEGPDKREAMASLRREMETLDRELHRERPHPRHAPGRPSPERLEHLRQAIEHLHAAGLPDVAAHVARHAEEWEHAHRRQTREPQPHGELHELRSIVEDLRHEVERLRDEVAQLRERREPVR